MHARYDGDDDDDDDDDDDHDHGSSHVQEAPKETPKICQYRHKIMSCSFVTIRKTDTFISCIRSASCLQVHSQRGRCWGDPVHSGERKHEAGLLLLPSA